MRDFYDAKEVYTDFSKLEVIETGYTSQDGVKVNVSIIKTPEYIGVRPALELFKGFTCEMPILNPSRLEHGNFSNTIIWNSVVRKMRPKPNIFTQWTHY